MRKAVLSCAWKSVCARFASVRVVMEFARRALCLTPVLFCCATAVSKIRENKARRKKPKNLSGNSRRDNQENIEVETQQFKKYFYTPPRKINVSVRYLCIGSLVPVNPL